MRISDVYAGEVALEVVSTFPCSPNQIKTEIMYIPSLDPMQWFPVIPAYQYVFDHKTKNFKLIKEAGWDIYPRAELPTDVSSVEYGGRSKAINAYNEALFAKLCATFPAIKHPDSLETISDVDIAIAELVQLITDALSLSETTHSDDIPTEPEIHMYELGEAYSMYSMKRKLFREYN